MTSEEYGQYIDDFELGADVMPGESLTEYIKRRQQEFESKADGGSIGIEVLFEPKRKDFNIGGQAQKTNTTPYDPRASIQDYAAAMQKVGAGTDAQKLQAIGEYGLNQMQNSPSYFKAVGQGINQHMLNNQMLRDAFDAKRITEDQYKLMGGYDVARLSPKIGLGNIKIGGTPGDVGIASAIYNAIKAGGIGAEKLGIKETDPFNQYGDIGFFGSIAKNYQGAKGLSESDRTLYEDIISGKTQSDMDRFRSGLYAANQVDKATGDRLYGGNIENLFEQYKKSPSTFFYAGDETQDMYDRFNKYYADGGRVGMVSGGALKGLMSLFKGGDKAADLAKQEEIFRKGPITKEFLETVDSKVINPFVRTRDMKGPGSYGLYDNFDDMPAGLKAAEIIKRFVDRKTGKINYEDAEFFIGRKLKGDETIDELIDIAISKPIGMGKGPFKDFEEYVLGGQKKADGGRVGLFMGGPALEGQALQIYNSMKGYNFSDQEIADALSARGLYTPAGSGSTQPEQVTGIINQQIQTGGDNDGQTGFGKFGNLDPTTEKEVTVNFYDEEYGDFVPTKTKVYQNTKSGLFQTIDGKNAFPAFSNKGAAFGLTGIIAQALGGKPKTVGGYVPGSIQGKYDGIGDMFSNIKNPFNLFKKQQATVADINAMNKKAVDDLRAKQAAEEAAKRRELENKIISGGPVITGGGGGGGNITTSAGTFAPGDYSDVAGTLADPREKMDYYRDGGLATMFTRRR